MSTVYSVSFFFYLQKTSFVLLSGVGRGRKTNPFKFGDDKLLSSVFPGTYRTASVFSDGVLITEDVVLQSKQACLQQKKGLS